MSHRIPHRRSELRFGRAHRRPLSLIWPSLIWSVLALLCPVPLVSDIVLVAPVDLLLEMSWVVPPSPKLVSASAEVVYWGIVESPELCSDMSTIRSRFSPLKSPVSPVSMEGVEQVVVKSSSRRRPTTRRWLLWI